MQGRGRVVGSGIGASAQLSGQCFGARGVDVLVEKHADLARGGRALSQAAAVEILHEGFGRPTAAPEGGTVLP